MIQSDVAISKPTAPLTDCTKCFKQHDLHLHNRPIYILAVMVEGVVVLSRIYAMWASIAMLSHQVGFACFLVPACDTHLRRQSAASRSQDNRLTTARRRLAMETPNQPVPILQSKAANWEISKRTPITRGHSWPASTRQQPPRIRVVNQS